MLCHAFQSYHYLMLRRELSFPVGFLPLLAFFSAQPADLTRQIPHKRQRPRHSETLISPAFVVHYHYLRRSMNDERRTTNGGRGERQDEAGRGKETGVAM